MYKLFSSVPKKWQYPEKVIKMNTKLILLLCMEEEDKDKKNENKKKRGKRRGGR